MAIPVTYAVSAQRAVDLVVANCSGDRRCHAKASALAADFAQLLARFDAGPIPASVRTRTGETAAVSMRRGDFGYSVRGILYRANAIATLPDLIGRAAASGDVSEFAQASWTRHAGFDVSALRR